MKQAAGATTVLLALLVLCIIHMSCLRRDTTAMQKYLSHAEAAETGQEQLNCLSDAAAYWDHASNRLCLTHPHEQIDAITQALSQLIVRAETDTAEEMRPLYTSASELLLQLYSSQQLRLYSIL